MYLQPSTQTVQKYQLQNDVVEQHRGGTEYRRYTVLVNEILV